MNVGSRKQERETEDMLRFMSVSSTSQKEVESRGLLSAHIFRPTIIGTMPAASHRRALRKTPLDHVVHTNPPFRTTAPSGPERAANVTLTPAKIKNIRRSLRRRMARNNGSKDSFEGVILGST